MQIEKLKELILTHTTYTFARSGGKGGQNVNKVNTKVHAMIPLIKILNSEIFTQTQLNQIQRKLEPITNNNGIVCIDVDDERFQEVNKKIAYERLFNRIVTAAYIKPKRKRTKPTASSKEKRLDSKRKHSVIKKLRQTKLNMVN